MNPSQQAGFTLIELITCMVILGILAGIVGPRLVENRTVHAHGFADDLANSLRYAQRVAIASNCEVRVTVTAAGYNTFQRTPAGNTCSAAGAWNQPVLRIDGTALTAASPSGVAPTPNRTITFRIDGVPAAGATNVNVAGRLVVIDGTGRVSVQ